MVRLSEKRPTIHLTVGSENGSLCLNYSTSLTNDMFLIIMKVEIESMFIYSLEKQSTKKSKCKKNKIKRSDLSFHTETF